MNQTSLEVRKLAVLPGWLEIPAKSFLMGKLVATILRLSQALDICYSSSSAGQSHLCSKVREQRLRGVSGFLMIPQELVVLGL